MPVHLCQGFIPFPTFKIRFVTSSHRAHTNHARDVQKRGPCSHHMDMYSAFDILALPYVYPPVPILENIHTSTIASSYA